MPSPPSATLALPPRLARGDWIVVLVPTLAALLAYVTTAAPDIVVEGDCAELAAAAHVAGIPHAPGFPSYMLLASTLARLVALEQLPRALNLMSAVFGAVTVGLVALAALRLVLCALPLAGAMVRRGAALLAGSLLALATEFWNQSLGAEVYTLSTALLALCLERTWSGSRRAREVAALAAGLAFGVHYNTAVPCALIVLASAWSARRTLAARAWGRLAGGFTLGLATFLYLPLRSLTDPAVDFGDPETPGRLWRLITLADMPTGRSLGRGLGELGAQLAAVGGLAAQQWPAWVFGLAGAGLLVLVLRPSLRGAALALGLVLALDYAGILAMANFEPVDEQVYELRFLFLPGYLVLALAGGMAFAWLGVELERRARWAVPLGLALFGLALVPWARAQHRRLDKSADRVFPEYGTALLLSAEGPSVLFTFGDNAWMPVHYLQTVWQLRRDVTLVSVRLLSHAWYRDQLRARHPQLVLDESAPGMAGVARANAARARLYHADPRVRDVPGFQEVPSGLLMRLFPAGEAVTPGLPSAPRFSARYAALDKREHSILADLPHAFLRTAVWCRQRGHPSAAERALEIGLGLTLPEPRLAEFHLVRAALWLELGELQAARGERWKARASWASARDEAPGTPPAEQAAKRLQSEAGAGPEARR